MITTIKELHELIDQPDGFFKSYKAAGGLTELKALLAKQLLWSAEWEPRHSQYTIDIGMGRDADMSALYAAMELMTLALPDLNFSLERDKTLEGDPGPGPHGLPPVELPNGSSVATSRKLLIDVSWWGEDSAETDGGNMPPLEAMLREAIDLAVGIREMFVSCVEKMDG